MINSYTVTRNQRVSTMAKALIIIPTPMVTKSRGAVFGLCSYGITPSHKIVSSRLIRTCTLCVVQSRMLVQLIDWLHCAGQRMCSVSCALP